MKITKSLQALVPWIFAALAMSVGALAQTPPTNAFKDSATCMECHDDIAKRVTSHKSCTGCHANLNPREMPHSPTGKSAKQIVEEGPQMCIGCHDKKLFQGKVVHAPVEAGKCTVCHDAHTSEHIALLKVDPVTQCLDCHADVKKGPHVISGFSRNGHPLGNDKKQVDDPLRPGKVFYCASCHEPHRSERPKLNRFALGMESCMKCHKM